MSRSRKIIIKPLTYTNLTPMPEPVGGYDTGTTFENVTFKDLIDGLLYPYQYPSFNSFTISGQSTVLECGVYVNGLNRIFSWETINSSNIEPNSITIKDSTNNIIIGSNLSDDGSETLTFGDVVKTNTGDEHIWSIEAINTKGEILSKDFTVTWYDPFYYGVGNSNLGIDQIQQLNKLVIPKSNKTLSFSPNNQVYYFAYPSSYGNLVSILDTNGFEIINDFKLRLEFFTRNSPYFENNNINYNVYEFNNLTTQTDFNITFKFS